MKKAIAVLLTAAMLIGLCASSLSASAAWSFPKVSDKICELRRSFTNSPADGLIYAEIYYDVVPMSEEEKDDYVFEKCGIRASELVYTQGMTEEEQQIRRQKMNTYYAVLGELNNTLADNNAKPFLRQMGIGLQYSGQWLIYHNRQVNKKESSILICLTKNEVLQAEQLEYIEGIVCLRRVSADQYRTVLFENTRNWENVYAYCSSIYGLAYDDYPGSLITETVTDEDGREFYVIKTYDPVGEIILNNGNDEFATEIDSDSIYWGGYYAYRLSGEKDRTGHYIIEGFDKTENVPTSDPDDGSFVLLDNYGWKEAYIYATDEDGNELYGAFPGKQAERFIDYGGMQFKITVPDEATGIVVSNSKGEKTQEIQFLAPDCGYSLGSKDENGDYKVNGFYGYLPEPGEEEGDDWYEPDVFSVVGSSTAIFGKAWDKDDTSTEMTLDPEDGLYKLTLENVQPEENIYVRVIRNHAWSEDWGNYYKEYPVFHVIAPCDVTITYDVDEDEINVYGDHVTYVLDTAEYVIAVGTGSGTFLNGADWDPEDESNKMAEVSDDVYEISYSGVAKGSYQFKFTANSVGSANPWGMNWGSEYEQNYPVDTEIGGVFNGKNCGFEVAEDNSTVTLRLDLSNYDYRYKQGAKMKCTVTPPEGNRYEDEFKAWSVNKFGEECMTEDCKYDELYTHYNGDDPDWVLVFASFGNYTPIGISGFSIGGVGGRTICESVIYNPFGAGYAVYDVKENEFYGLECFADNPDQCYCNPETSLDYSKYDGLIEALTDLKIGKLTGDIFYGDGTVDILDATFIQKVAADKEYIEFEECFIADVNSDGVVDILDATAIQKYAVS